MDLSLPEGLTRPWALGVVGLVVLALVLWWSRPRRAAADPLLLARTSRLRRLPAYQAAVRRHRRVGALLALGGLLVVAGTALVLARPDVVEDGRPDARNRDLMLCLDVSPSMNRDNLDVIREVRQVVKGLRGDRIGLLLWSGAAVLAFPLTDDYDFVEERLDQAEQTFSGHGDTFLAGVNRNDQGVSLIGDGLVSCVNRFDGGGSDRTRAVLLVSDNHPFGEQLFTLPEAAEHATDQHVLVYGLAASSLARAKQAPALAEFTKAVRSTGGTLVQLSQEGGTDKLVGRINDLEKARARQPARPVSREAPAAGLLVAGLGTLLLLMGWVAERRLRRRGGAS